MLSQETEIKINLGNEDNYKKLLSFFPGRGKVTEQENYFFDSSHWILSKSGWALRIRLEEGCASIALKGTSSEIKEGLAIRPEISAQIPYDRAQAFIREGIDDRVALPSDIVAAFRKSMSGIKLKKMVDFKNRRTSILHNLEGKELLLEIDRTLFANGEIDFELEVEIPDDRIFETVVRGLEQLLNELDIPLKFHVQSKFARALKRSALKI